jgi:hypothetical protein
MTEMAKSRTTILNGLFWVAIAAAVVYLLMVHVGVVSNVVVVLLGFGSVVLVHEFGHFIVAKLGGSRSRRSPSSCRRRWWGSADEGRLPVRFLPSLTSRGNEETRSRPRRPSIASDLSVRRLREAAGQEDTGPVKQVADPRSLRTNR